MNEENEIKHHRRDLIVASFMSAIFVVALLITYLIIGRDGTFEEIARSIYGTIVQ